MQKLFLTFIFCLCAHGYAFGAKAPLPPTPAVVNYIFDGDTFAATVELKNDVRISVRVRILDIDAPEIKGECDSEITAAYNAKERLSQLIPIGSTVELSKIKDDKYLGRIDALVKNSDGLDVSETMIREKHA